MKTSLVISVCLLSIIAQAQQAPAQNFEKALDSMLEAKFSNDEPGGTVLVAKEGNIVYHKAFGKADLELGVGMKPDHVFRIGSITKQFTACAVMRLAEQGRLSLQDTITRFIKDYPKQGRSITIEHLLTHTSGIKNITAMPAWTSEVQRRDLTPKELVNFFKNEPLDFLPGSAYRYSNSNYILLGHIIEIITHVTYSEYLNQNFFKPLGMTQTTCDNFSAIIPNRIKGYQKTEGHYNNADFLSMTQPLSAGAIVSNTKDLFAWYDAVMSNKIVSQASREKAQSPFRLPDGEATNYGYGWEVGNIQGSNSIKHGGKINGFVAYSIFLPHEKVFVAIFSNCECTTDLEIIASKIAAIAINKPFKWKPIRVNESILNAYEGVYESQKGDDRIVSLEDGELLFYSPRQIKSQLIPFSKDEFHIENTLTSLHFIRDKEGKVTSFTIQSTESPTLWTRGEKKITKRKAIVVAPGTFDQYTGRYQFGAGYFLVTKEGNKLYGKAPGESQVRQEIVPFDKHMFFAKKLDAEIKFNVDNNGKIISLTIIQNGEKTALKLN